MTNNVRRALSPLLIISYVVGTRIVEFPAGNPRPRLGIPYMLLLWSIYHFLLACTVISYITHYSIEYHICFWLNSFTVLLSIILGLYHDKVGKHLHSHLLIMINDTDFTYVYLEHASSERESIKPLTVSCKIYI